MTNVKKIRSSVHTKTICAVRFKNLVSSILNNNRQVCCTTAGNYSID